MHQNRQTLHIIGHVPSGVLSGKCSWRFEPHTLKAEARRNAREEDFDDAGSPKVTVNMEWAGLIISLLFIVFKIYFYHLVTKINFEIEYFFRYIVFLVKFFFM